MRAQVLLGEAMAAQGDVPGACAAYRVVVERWGKAKPKSVTAERAAAGLAELDCADGALDR